MKAMLEVEGLDVAYGDFQVLWQASIRVGEGEIVAVLGPNGAGKSTLMNAVSGLLAPRDGRITFQGKRIDGLPAHRTAGEGLAHVLERRRLFPFLTVRDNVLLGDPTRIDDAAMHAAIRKAGARELVEALPAKYDQVLGTEFEDGEQLSGGQWQKLAIARAFYQAAPVLIMDEPTSAIDAEAEYEIFTNLEAEYRDKTLILVSHRFSTVRNADRIIVLEDGRIAEHGSHDELVANRGRYASMFAAQAAGYR